MWSITGFYSWTAAFLVSVNDLSSSSKILNPIMFPDDTNLFYDHKNIIKP